MRIWIWGLEGSGVGGPSRGMMGPWLYSIDDRSGGKFETVDRTAGDA